MHVLILLAALIGSAPAFSSLSAYDVIEECEDEGGTGELACLYFVDGALTMAAWYEIGIIKAPKNVRPYCTPDSFNNGIGVKVWMKYLEDNPAEFASPAALTLWNAMRGAYPCPRE